jgi:hypothetical protein
MKFNQEKMDEIKDALVKKGARKPCSICGSKDLVIVDELILMEISTGGKFPTIVTGCGNCGKTEIFGANTLVPGLLSSSGIGEL